MVKNVIKDYIRLRDLYTPKKVLDIKNFGICPNCGYVFNSELMNEYDVKFCLHCGQSLDWTED